MTKDPPEAPHLLGPSKASPAVERPFTFGGAMAILGLTTGALAALALLGVYALFLSEPPECFMRFVDDPDCVRARQDWTLLPSAVVGALAVPPLIALYVALVKHRSITMRWVTLGVIVACPAIAFLLP